MKTNLYFIYFISLYSKVDHLLIYIKINKTQKKSFLMSCCSSQYRHIATSLLFV